MSVHDPYRPKRSKGRTPPRSAPAQPPARKGHDLPSEQPETTAGVVLPGTAEAAIEHIDAANTAEDEAERAAEVWAAELTRTSGDGSPAVPRKTVQRRVSRVLQDVPDPDAPGSPESDEPDGTPEGTDGEGSGADEATSPATGEPEPQDDEGDDAEADTEADNSEDISGGDIAPDGD